MSHPVIEAGTEAWTQIRLGRVTASRITDVIARTKTGWGASRANYAAELIVERLTRKQAESFTSPAMQWGTDHEAEAISAYVFLHDGVVTPAGFVEHPNINMAGATPDGYAAPDGLIEVKCPNTATHIETLLKQKVPAKYVCQMQWQMACTGRKWCDFISFDPRLPVTMRLFVKRLHRDEQMIAELGGEVIAFLAEVEDTLFRLGALYEIDGVEPTPAAREMLVASAKECGIPHDWAMGG